MKQIMFSKNTFYYSNTLDILCLAEKVSGSQKNGGKIIPKVS